MPHQRNDYGWLLGGAVVIAAGSGLAGTHAFEGDVLQVAAGIVLFFAGFKLSQFGVYRWPDRRLVDVVRGTGDGVDPRTVGVRVVALAIGALLIAGGITLFARTIVEPGAERATLAGITSITGYMFAHYGMMGRTL